MTRAISQLITFTENINWGENYDILGKKIKFSHGYWARTYSQEQKQEQEQVLPEVES